MTMHVLRLTLAVLLILVTAPPTLADGTKPTIIAPQSGQALAQTYLGAGFILRYPDGYTARPFVGGVALVQAGHGEVLTATLLTRPSAARRLSATQYARQFASLNIQGAGALMHFEPFRLLGSGVAYRGTWRRVAGASSPAQVGPLYLVPLDPAAQHWLILSAHGPLLDTVARHITLRR